LGGHFEEALAIQHRLLELDPAFLGAHAGAARTSLLLGKNPDALAEAQKETDEESRLVNLALVYWAMGRRSEADTALNRLESQFANASAYDIGTLHAYRNEPAVALGWLERAYQQRDLYIVFLKVDPLLRNIHSDPHYKVLLRKMQLPN
jgi:tetratricopeptide (TPR) repeat protein